MGKEEFIELFGPYYQATYKYCYALTLDEELAEELTQATYITAFNYAEYFAAFDSLEAALKGIAKRIKYKATAQAKREFKLLEKIKRNIILRQAETALDEILCQKELKQELQIAIESLPDSLKQVIALNYSEGMPMVEVAEVLGIKYTTALSRKNAALKALKKQLAKQGVTGCNIRFLLFLLLWS